MATRKTKKTNLSPDLTLDEIHRAEIELRKYFPPSPLIPNLWLSEIYKCNVFLKLETAQPIGSFKIRGATYKISQLDARHRRKGVIAASAGNHAQGVAWGSRQLGVKSTIVMPFAAPITKLQNTKNLGAEVVLHGDSYDQAYQHALSLAKKSGAVFVHAFNDLQVLAGQGTVGTEIFAQLPNVDAVIGAVGGGGLIYGVGTALKTLKPKCKIIACQSEGASSMIESLKKHRPLVSETVQTFADGIAVKSASPEMLARLERVVDWTATEGEVSIADSVLTLLEKTKILTEGAAAITLSTLARFHDRLRGKNVVLILGGGNLDVNVLNRIIDVGLVRAGRRVRVNVVVRDKPGSLSQLTQLIASEGVNVLQAIHDRDEPHTRFDETEVALTLETRGREATQHIIKTLREHVLRLDLV